MRWIKRLDGTTGSLLGIAALIYALYIPLALSVAHFHVPRPMPPEPRLQLLRSSTSRRGLSQSSRTRNRALRTIRWLRNARQ